MKQSSRKLVLALVLSVAGCDCDDDEPIDYVSTRVNPNADFAEYHTFAVLDENSINDFPDRDVDIDIEDLPDEVRANIASANDQAREELEARGLIEVDPDEEPDLIVANLAGLDEDGGYVWTCYEGWYWWGWWGWAWDPCAYMVPVYVEYTVGSVLLGLVDPKNEDVRVAFSGFLQGYADYEGDAEDRVRSGVHVMFEDYPEEGDHTQEH